MLLQLHFYLPPAQGWGGEIMKRLPCKTRLGVFNSHVICRSCVAMVMWNGDTCYTDTNVLLIL